MGDDLYDSSSDESAASQVSGPAPGSGGSSNDGGGGGDDGGSDGGNQRVPDAVRNAAQFVGIDVPQNAQREPEPEPEPDDSSGGFVDNVVDTVQDTARNVRDRVESGARAGPLDEGMTDSGGSPEPSQDAIDESLAERGGAAAEGINDPTVPDAQEPGQRSTGPGNKTGKGPFPDSGPAGSNPNVAVGDVNLPDADDQGDLTDELADGRLTRSEVVAETEDVEAPGPRGDRQEERQARLGEDPNRFQRRIRRARENLEEQAISESPAIDDPGDVNIERDGQTLRAELSEQGLRGALASQSPVINDPSNVDVSGDPDDIAQAVNAGAVGLTAGVPDRSSSTSVPTAPTGGGSGLDGSNLPGGVPSGRANRQPAAAEQLSGFDLSEDPDFADLGVARQQTRAPGVTQDRFRIDEDRTTVSPFAGIALDADNDQQIRQAVQGSREVARRANQGGVGAQVAEIGRDLQEQGVGISEGIQDEIPLDDAGPQVGDATVGDQVEGFIGGTAGFPSQFLGGGVQAAGLAASGGTVDRAAVEQFPDRFDTAADAQADFAASRPVEAGLIAGTVALGSPRARSAARQAGRRAADTGRTAAARANERLAFSERAQRFRTDESGQLFRQRGERSQRGDSGDQVEIAEEGRSPEPPQEMVERFRAREANQRVESSTRGRRTEFDIPGPNERARARQSVGRSPERAIEQELARLDETRRVDYLNREDFQFNTRAEEAFATLAERQGVSEAVPSSDLRTATVVPATSRSQIGSTAAGAGRSATVADRVAAEIDQSGAVESEVTLEGPGSGMAGDVTASSRVDTRGGPADAVTRDIQTLVAEAQRPRARVNNGVQRGGDSTFGADGQRDLAGDAGVQLREEAQQSEVTGAEAGEVPGSGQRSGGRSRVDVGPGERTEPGVDTGTDIEVGVGEGRIDDVDVPAVPDSTPNTRVNVFSTSASVTTPEFTTDVPGDPSNPRNPNPPNRNRRRPPGPPLPGFPDGGSPGSGGGPFALDSDRTFPSGIESGPSAFSRVFTGDDSSDNEIFRNDDDDDGLFDTSGFDSFTL